MLEEDLVTRFADIISTVSLKDPTTVDIVRKVNFHHCTKACRKYSDFCRFHFPKFPVVETLVATPSQISFPDPENRKLATLKIKLVLSKVKKVLKDNALMTVIVRDTEKQDIKSRIIAVLRRAEICEDLGVSNNDELYNRYVECLKVSFRGYQIILKRDIDEIFINNYNSEWIRAWNANLDIQLCLDHYAIVTYIMEYLNKDESGTFEFINRALKDSENAPFKEKLKLVKNTFQTHRQIGPSEAVYKLFSAFHMSGSNIGTQFVHSGFRYNQSKMLRQISEEEAKRKGKNAIVLAEHPDKYFEETTSLENRYDDRPRSLQHITLSQFAKRYTLGSKIKSNMTEKISEENLSDDNENYCDEINLEESDDDIDDIYKSTIISYYPELRTNLPKLVHIGSRSMQLRSPICLRYHKYKMSSESHEYYFSQLRLFYPHNKEDMNIWEADPDKCRQAFNMNEEAIKYVRGKVMKYQEQVEVNQEKAQADYDASVGDILDSTMEQDMSDCKDEGYQDPDNFVALDPSLAPVDKSDLCEVKASKYVKIELSNLDDLLKRTRSMDPDQRRIVSIGVEFAQNVRKSRYNDVKRPSPPYIVVQGNAGSGKSFVINTMTEWMERIFRQPGDNPNYPYILRLAFTGTAANMINGQTINSSLKLPFGNILHSLDNKTAARIREELKNLQVVIIDEYSMVRPDMFYQIDVRLQEIKQKIGVPFGGVAVFLFGDILQLRPTTSKKFIFQAPSNDKYRLSFNSESLFGELFEKHFLSFNHRQGEDYEYSEILNRIRFGKLSPDDCRILETRVFQEGDPEIPKDALYIAALNDEVNEYNKSRLNDIPGEVIKFDTVILNKTGAMRKPTLTNAGEVRNTPLQAYLRLKIGARVMLTYNIDTCDGLTNGAMGEFIGFETGKEKQITRLYVHFFENKVGKEKRKNCFLSPYLKILKKKYPEKLPTPVDKLEFRYSLTNDRNSSENIAINFPLRLCFAATGHKCQGKTVKKPEKLVVHLKHVFEPAQAYVILSRVQCLNQLYIKNGLYPEKIYASDLALAELESMQKSKQTNCTEAELKILSLNIRSLPKHFDDLTLEDNILDYDLVLLQQTCLTGDHQPPDSFSIDHYHSHFNSTGTGGGLAIYHTDCFSPSKDIKKPHYQLSLISSSEFDVICVYRSTSDTQNNQIEFLTDLNSILNNRKRTIITGDFNTNPTTSVIGREMLNWDFTQMISYPTHCQGNLLDHCYISDKISVPSVKINQTPVYYTDHDKIEIVINKL